mmetsp:Transcript_8871/g.28129  ORF Transcript_8871/g.28129 Transcript_8871/m.28129 type:complete len:211 (-) Transcript_8871:1910-2542(-)
MLSSSTLARSTACSACSTQQSSPSPTAAVEAPPAGAVRARFGGLPSRDCVFGASEAAIEASVISSGNGCAAPVTAAASEPPAVEERCNASCCRRRKAWPRMRRQQKRPKPRSRRYSFVAASHPTVSSITTASNWVDGVCSRSIEQVASTHAYASSLDAISDPRGMGGRRAAASISSAAWRRTASEHGLLTAARSHDECAFCVRSVPRTFD